MILLSFPLVDLYRFGQSRKRSPYLPNWSAMVTAWRRNSCRLMLKPTIARRWKPIFILRMDTVHGSPLLRACHSATCLHLGLQTASLSYGKYPQTKRPFPYLPTSPWPDSSMGLNFSRHCLPHHHLLKRHFIWQPLWARSTVLVGGGDWTRRVIMCRIKSRLFSYKCGIYGRKNHS